VKWLLDRLLSFLGLVLLSPVFAGLALWIVFESGLPVIFRQLRAGKGAKPFSMLKFRTMVPNAVELGRELQLSDDPFGLLPNDPRITPRGFGAAYSLDELPRSGACCAAR
jgi:lipopolysaccharide/colanic/teichoic acid biosynthesis glycosyltransferase